MQAALAAAAAAGVVDPARLLAQGRPTQQYDDGSDEIPGGLEGEPERVIIVGAGFAGLAASNALTNAGVPNVVLEGRRRLGGRARTKDIGGYPVDLGCSWIHDPVGNPMTRFAEQAGVARTNADIELDVARFRFWDGPAGRELAVPEKLEAFGHVLGFDDEAGDISDELGPGASIRDGAFAYLDRHGLEGDRRRRTAYVLRLVSEQFEANWWGNTSLSYAANYENPYTGVGEGEFPVGGYRRLVAAMGAVCDVRLGHTVVAVERDRRGVRVLARQRGSARRGVRVFRGSHVIVTVPLGVLQRGRVRFDPVLPRRKRQAIGRLRAGRFEKVAMAFPEPFWADATHSHIVHMPAGGGYGFPITLDVDQISGIPVLVAFNAGRPARRVEQLPRQRVLAQALEMLREVTRGPVPAPLDWHVTNWRKDPFCLGAYTSVAKGTSTGLIARMAEPVDGRLLFAGEATASRNGYADGAMSSGIREAKRLLKRPSVPLSAG